MSEDSGVDSEVEAQEMEVPSSHRAKQFCYYFLRALEDKIVMYLDILEGKPNPNVTTSSLPGKATAGGAGAIPFVGKAISIASQEADKFILSKLVKKDAKVLATFVYSYRNDADLTRKIIVKAGLEIFIAFEMQFMSVTCDGGKTRAMQKLAMDAAYRIIRYFLEISSDAAVTKDVVVRGVLNGISEGNVLGLNKTGRTLRNENNKEWKSGKVFAKTGVCLFEEANKMRYYKRDVSHSEKYGHRLKFSFEDEDLIRELWELDEAKFDFDYPLAKSDFTKLLVDTWIYVVKHDPNLEAKYDRELFHKEAALDRESKHQESMEDRQKKNVEAKEERLNFHNNTLSVLTDLHEATQSGNLDNFVQGMKDRKEKLESIITYMKELHDLTSEDTKKQTKEITNKIVEVKNEITTTKIEFDEKGKKIDEENQTIKKQITEIKEEIDTDGAIVIKIDKHELADHPDVKNVRNFIKDTDKTLVDNDPSSSVKDIIKTVDTVLVANDPSHDIKQGLEKVGDSFAKVFGW